MAMALRLCALTLDLLLFDFICWHSCLLVKKKIVKIFIVTWTGAQTR